MVELRWLPGQLNVVWKTRLNRAVPNPGEDRGKSPALDACHGAAVPSPPDVTPVIEGLGEKTVQHVIVLGCRVSFPVGSGVDTTETWTSRELRLVLSRFHRNSKGNEDSTTLTNLVLDEPDPKLFMPPATYKIQDMSQGR